MKITTQYISDYEYKSTTENGNSVSIDMKPEGKTLQSPMELVLSALSGCVAVEIALMIQKKRRTLAGLKIEANGERKTTDPKGFTKIKLHFILDSPDAQIEELQKVSALALDKYCSVADSLKASITHKCSIAKD
ncbi:MAG: OsmC family protein [Bacteroidota bacterium]